MPKQEPAFERLIFEARRESAERWQQDMALAAECMSRMELEARVLLSEKNLLEGEEGGVPLIGILTILTASDALAERLRYLVERAFAKSEIHPVQQIEWMRAATCVAAELAFRAKVMSDETTATITKPSDEQP